MLVKFENYWFLGFFVSCEKKYSGTEEKDSRVYSALGRDRVISL
jgi:hypothetical protein